MPNEHILAYDIGTSAVKASLVSAAMEITASVSVPYETSYTGPGEAVQDPNDWWECAVTASRQLAEKDSENIRNVTGIGISGHMLGMVAVDRQGCALFPALIHSDNRSAAEAKFFKESIGSEALYQMTGNVLGPSAPICKILWLKNNHAGIYANVHKFMQSKDYLAGRMTGNNDVTDYSDASHGMLLDIQKKEYLLDVFALAGIDPGKFPKLYKSTDIIGHLCKESALQLGLPSGIPVAAGGGDGVCASAGTGISAKGDIYCSLGTTAWIACHEDKPFIDEKMRIINILSLDGDACGVFGTIQCAGRAVTWAQDLFGFESPQALDRCAQSAPAGCDGLIFLPYLEGERSPIFDANARGVFYGLTPQHNRKHFSRSVLEGVAFALSSIVDVMREQSTIKSMRIIGGGASSALWRQIIADASRTEIVEITTSPASATSLGAAMAVSVGIGMYKDLTSAAKNITLTRTTLPDPARQAAYQATQKNYLSLYPLLKPMFNPGSKDG